MALDYKDLPMLARTHGQPAVPTTLGKELIVFAVRLHTQIHKLKEIQLTGKFSGAVGNFNAASFVFPKTDWMQVMERFTKFLGLVPNFYTTQINPFDDLIEASQIIQRINGVVLDLDQDMWRYISDNWFVQKVQKGEVGSSTMPQKINPIKFEKSEGNIEIANALFDGMNRKLGVSRLQRDLSNSTVIRNIGTVLGHSLLAYRNTLSGLKRVSPNKEVIRHDLYENWSILSEGVQTLLRTQNVKDAYSLVADLSKGQKIDQESWNSWVEHLSVSKNIKKRLFELSPSSYIGHASTLVERAVKDIVKNE
jgi:adenylosuccinate lyase